MKPAPQNPPPADAARGRAAPAVSCYAVDRLPTYDREFYDLARRDLTAIAETIIPPRDARAFKVPAGHFFRIISVDGPQVGDLNLWNANDLSERFL